MPFVLLGSSVRVVEDADFLTPPISYLFMTPFIYILIFLIAFPSLMILIRLKGEDYWKFYSAEGVILSLIVLILLFSNLPVVNGWVIPAAISGAFILTTIYSLVFSKIYSEMNNLLSRTVFFSHMVDGFATFLGIQYLGYWELHVLPRFLIDTFGAWVMVPAKIVVFLPILYILDSSKEDENFTNFIKFVLVVLGLAPGLRDALRMGFSV